MRVFLWDEGRVLRAKPGQTLSRLFQREGVSFALPCAGRGHCGQCALWISGELLPPEDREARLLTRYGGEAPPEVGYALRLACMARPLGDCRVRFRPEDRVRIEAGEGRALPAYDGEGGGLGFAVDIGTTTVALRLYDLGQGRLLETRSAENTQRGYGADVISRIAWTGEHGQEALGRALIRQLEGLMEDALLAAGVLPERVRRLVLTGNTAMLHFLTGLSAQGIGVAPFTPESLFGTEWPTGDIFPWLPPEASLYLPRCVGAYVGADITCGMLACGLREGGTRLLLDVGTNGEMALCHRGRMLACAAAAGPAFEGGEIERGMMAAPGAIDRVEIVEGQMISHVIGGGPARGICGTGLISAMAALLQVGRVDETGAIRPRPGEPEDCCPLGDSGVALTAQDIRKLQLAKAAMATGIGLLLEEAGAAPEDIAECFLAGGFGAALDPLEAAAIGLIPPALAAWTQGAGNLALEGAATLLLRADLRPASEDLARSVRVVPLATDPRFAQRFTDHLLFPSTPKN